MTASFLSKIIWSPFRPSSWYKKTFVYFETLRMKDSTLFNLWTNKTWNNFNSFIYFEDDLKEYCAICKNSSYGISFF